MPWVNSKLSFIWLAEIIHLLPRPDPVAPTPRSQTPRALKLLLLVPRLSCAHLPQPIAERHPQQGTGEEGRISRAPFLTDFSLQEGSGGQVVGLLWLIKNYFFSKFSWGIIPSTLAILPHFLMHSNLAFQNTEKLFHHWICLPFDPLLAVSQAQSNARWSCLRWLALALNMNPKLNDFAHGICKHCLQATWAYNLLQEWNGERRGWEHFFFLKLVICFHKWADFLPYERELLLHHWPY